MTGGVHGAARGGGLCCQSHGGSTMAGLVPSLKAWLVRFARDAIISYYVLPEQWTYRLAPVSMLVALFSFPYTHKVFMYCYYSCCAAVLHTLWLHAVLHVPSHLWFSDHKPALSCLHDTCSITHHY